MAQVIEEGWNGQRLSGVFYVFGKIRETSYELENCVRGCYTGCETYVQLSEFLKDLGNQLLNEAEGFDTSEIYYDDGEDEECDYDDDCDEED